MSSIETKNFNIATGELTETELYPNNQIVFVRRPKISKTDKIGFLDYLGNVEIRNARGELVFKKYLGSGILDFHFNNSGVICWITSNGLGIWDYINNTQLAGISISGNKFVYVGENYVVLHRGGEARWYDFNGNLIASYSDSPLGNCWIRGDIDVTGSIYVIITTDYDWVGVARYRLGVRTHWSHIDTHMFTGYIKVDEFAEKGLLAVIRPERDMFAQKIEFASERMFIYGIPIDVQPNTTDFQPKVYLSYSGKYGIYNNNGRHILINMDDLSKVMEFPNASKYYGSCIDDADEYVVVNYGNKIEIWSLKTLQKVAENVSLDIAYDLEIVRGYG